MSEPERLSRIKTIRKYCITQCDESAQKVKECSMTDCPLYIFRMGHRVSGHSPSKAIKTHCIECSGGNVYEPRKCPCKECLLWRYRCGKEETPFETKNPAEEAYF